MSAKSLTAFAAVAVLTVTALGGCAGTPSSQPGDTRFVAGEGHVEVFGQAERKKAPTIEGRTLDGTATAAPGGREVYVLNFWASWCSPCRAEAPVLKDIAAQTKPKGVRFLGINFKDQQASAEAYDRAARPGYPSIFDQSGRVLLAFQGTVPPAAIPSTLVIDRQGRIAARALGPVKYNDLMTAVTKVSDE